MLNALKFFLLSASSWLPVAVTAPSCTVGAYVSHSLCAAGGASRTLTDHRDEARPNRLPRRWAKSSRAALFALAASGPSENDDAALITAAKTTGRRRRSWEESYALLCAYGDVHGHCNVPQSEKPLGPWVNRQRIEHARYSVREKNIRDGEKGNKLPSTSMTVRREKMLEDIGFVWDAMGHTWGTRYDELCEFRKTNGHCVVPRSNGRLGAWVEKQRIEYKKYRAAPRGDARKGGDAPKTMMTEDRVRRMDDAGFVWDVREKQFQEKLGQLRISKEANGRIDPRFMDGRLAPWVRRREQQYRRYLDAAAASVDAEALAGILPESRRVALEDVGFRGGMFDEPRARRAKNRRATWEERYRELKEYKAEYDHCVVPKNYGPLGSWVRAQRHLMKEKGTAGPSFEGGGQLSDERVDRLDRLGFVWDVHQWQWNRTYHELLRYKDDRNDTNVPMSYGGLGLWVRNQRAHRGSRRRGGGSRMTPARLELLGSIGFEFDLGEKIRSAADERWQTRLDELKEHEEKWETFAVKQCRNPSLYNWCQHQRGCYRAKLRGKNSPLNKEREDALRTIGFLDGIG